MHFSGLLVVIAVMVVSADKPLVNKMYLGSQPSKIYFFPWLVTFHREVGAQREFMGSGSILTHKYVLASMDSFVRTSKFFGGLKGLVFFQDVGHLVVYSGSIWGNQYFDEDSPVGFDWLQRRRVEKIFMFSDTDTSSAQVDSFAKNSQPKLLNSFKRTPFGFSMAIALVKLADDRSWIWKRGTLPFPLFADRAAQVKLRLDSEVETLEGSPYNFDCYVGGWRNGDRRLVQYKVFYVPLTQCQISYCSYDSRACTGWPVKGVHVCFKSESYDDLCWRDQGSGLYCERISQSVIAILTSSPTCGYDDLPGVYTLVHHGVQLFERVAFPSDVYHPISNAERNRYTPPPKEDLHPFYH